jgi:hypothetical protein
MILRLLAPLVAIATVAAASPASAEDAGALAPSSPWTLDYDADSCALRRTFGSGEDQAIVEFRRFGPGLGLQTIVGSSRLKARNNGSFRYRFDDGEDWQIAGYTIAMTLANGYSAVLFYAQLPSVPWSEDVGDDPARIESYNRSDPLKAAERERAATIDHITLVGAFGRQYTLRFGSLEKPMKAMQECVDELMTHWNIDVEAHKTLMRPAIPVNLAEVPRMMDYPPRMVRESMPGLVNIRLAIDETGRITGCRIQMPLSDPAFEESTCADIQHALDFDPALDKDGKPIASFWITRVVFTLNQLPFP